MGETEHQPDNKGDDTHGAEGQAEQHLFDELVAAGDGKKARSAMRTHLLAARRNSLLSGSK